MDAETLIWTLVFFGSTVVIVAFLLSWAIVKDRQKSRDGVHDED